jgi:hypothetical protein
MTSDLTKEEELEYYRQVRIYDNPHFHEEAKCGQQLKPFTYYKRHTKFHRQSCPVHEVIVSMSGWEIGFEGGSPSRELNKKS